MKYHKSECFGLLLGRKSEQGGKREVTIEDAVPLFHNKVTSGSLEIAFEMVESTMTNEAVKIVGIYEAPLVSGRGTDNPTQMAYLVA